MVTINRKGFTLMEILAVLLVIAVVASFAVPMVRKVRAEVQYKQAKTAALKMAEAMRNYYQNTRGYLLSGSVTGNNNLAGSVQNVQCDNPSASGIPTGTGTYPVAQLFACDYLTVKDFAGLPYTFTPDSTPFTSGNLVKVTGLAAAGPYKDKVFYVVRDMSIKE